MAIRSLSSRENWLNRIIAVQRTTDAQLTGALQAALEDLDRHLSRLEGRPGVGAAVRRAQLLGNRGIINQVLAALFKDVGDIVKEGQANAAGAATQAEFTAAKKIYETIIEDTSKRKILQLSLDQSARRNIDSLVTKETSPGHPLSRRIYRTEALSKGLISRVISNHLARGSSAADMAKDLRPMFKVNVPGGVSYAAQRLARTEINNAFHLQSAADMSDRPWVNQSRWHLSGSHPTSKPDECDEYARTGLFPVDSIPHKPHPNCLCYVTPEMPDIETVLNSYFAGEYNSWIAKHTDDGIRRSA